MPSLSCSAVLFDMDGVLIDSTPCVTRVWRQWAIEHQLDPDRVVHVAHGRRSIETIREVAPHLDAERENEIVESRELKDTDGITVFDGARELLTALPRDRWTIVTSATRPLALVRLDYAGLPIPAEMVTADDVTLGKPNPEPYLAGAAKLGIPIGECVVFEDAPSGLRAAKSAGARSFGIPTTYRREELTEATVILDNLRQARFQGASDGRLRFEF